MKNWTLALISNYCIWRLGHSVILQLVCICLVGSLTPLKAQQVLIDTQYFLNPFVYNLYIIGNQGYTEAFSTHRRQWIEMEGAPLRTALSLHLPTRTKLALRANLFTIRESLLSPSNGMVKADYTLQLSHNQFLRADILVGFL